VCSGLQCLCRPRFFAGQILSEDDLNRLETYFIDKNKLHNRYLHGWGVVCGLEVVCSSCGDRVSVQPGYALSPCGDDIIVCAPDTALICDLINKCRPTDHPDPNCPPLAHGDPGDCGDAIDSWVLAICYDEKPSRGITALRGSSGSSCCSKCACGGSGNCGCGCHGKGGGGHSHASNGKDSCGCGGRAARPTSPQCEPTLVCEGYKFIVYKPEPSEERESTSELIERILKCLSCLDKGHPAVPKPTADNAAWRKYCCDFKRWLADAIARYSTTRCTLFDLLGQIHCPDAPPGSTQAYRDQINAIIKSLGPIVGELARRCICAAIIPPCPGPVECNCVPLATVSVRRRDCKIMEICNWGPRKFAITFPLLDYWLGLTNIMQVFQEQAEAICCEPLEMPDLSVIAPKVVTVQPNAGMAWPGDTTTFAKTMSAMWSNTGRTLNAATLGYARIGATDPKGKPLMSDFEMQNPAHTLLVNQVLRPLIEKVFPPELTRFMAGLAQAPTESHQEFVELRNAVQKLTKITDAQRNEIEELKRRM
jgi:hypothetical protein